VNRNHFLEWAHFAGARYGTPREPVEKALNSGRNVLLEIEIEGAKQVKIHAPEAILVFLEPPSWEELVSRLEKRATDSPQRRAERLQLAQEELAAASFFDHRLINDEVESVAQKLLSLASAQ
jgi:guanylate kinase